MRFESIASLALADTPIASAVIDLISKNFDDIVLNQLSAHGGELLFVRVLLSMRYKQLCFDEPRQSSSERRSDNGSV
jgi:hypothetical protein